MSFHRWMDSVVHADNGILFSTKKKWPVKPWKDMEETYMHITKCKKPMWKGYVLYDSRSKCTCGVWDVSTHKGEMVPVSGPEVYMRTLFSAQLCSEPKTSLKNNVYLNNKLYPKDEIKSNRTVPWIEDSYFAGWDSKALTAAHLIHLDFSIQSTKPTWERVVGFFSYLFRAHNTWTRETWVEPQFCHFVTVI